MFSVDEPTAEAIRKAYNEGGELAGVVELRQHFPLIADNPDVRLFVRTIAGWTPLPAGTGRLPSRLQRPKSVPTAVKVKKDEI